MIGQLMSRQGPRGPRRWRVLAIAVGLVGLGGTATLRAEAGAPAAAQVQCSAPAWNSGAIYNQDDVVSHDGRQWRATHWMWAGVEPGVSGSPPWWVPWADLGPCDGGTTTTQLPGSTTTTPGSTTTTAPPSESVDQFYAAAGPWAVSTGTGPGVTTFYPTDLGANGYNHPILTWGNGTGGTCTGYQETERHYASWGFVVICANSSWTGSGSEIWSAAQWMVTQDSSSGSIFFGNLDTDRIAAAGHSQGASGAVNAAILSGGEIDGVFALSLVDPWAHIWGPLPNFSQLTAPVFFLSGTNDQFITQASQQNYYDQVPGPAAKAARTGANHDNINGPTTGRGYGTAWLKYTVEADTLARQAFVGSPPQINADPGYTNQAEKNLP
jgi:hypothetical protein